MALGNISSRTPTAGDVVWVRCPSGDIRRGTVVGKGDKPFTRIVALYAQGDLRRGIGTFDVRNLGKITAAHVR